MEKLDIDLNKFMQKQDDVRVSFENLIDSLDGDFVELQNLIEKIYKKSENYDSYDYRDDIKDILGDMLWTGKNIEPRYNPS